MDISIIIVNYNVKHFLEQCLHSVQKSTKDLTTEVFVIDNKSVDGSCQMVSEKFPEVKLIENQENVGFSKANNQAIKLAKGKYILLLNPDTILPEDTLVKCFSFMESKPVAGGLGVKMIDGKGNYLPESKRSLPTPAVAFFKIFGLSTLFPKSKTFGKYHLGFLDKEQTHQIEILAGAFMFLRKEVLDKIGLLDETFFMYGEDIDMSYRITQAGYLNYYYPETTIIHYKGESTKKGSINYVMVFYKAMIIFANKHFSSKNANLYKLLINIAIYIRAALGIIRRVALTLLEPVLDFFFIYTGFYAISSYWEHYRFGINQYYPEEFYLYVLPVYTLCWMFFTYLFGGYEKKIKLLSLARGVLSGTIFILLAYALLPESLRFSRAMVLLGAGWTMVGSFLVRIIGTYIIKGYRNLSFSSSKKRIAIVGSEKEARRVVSILGESNITYDFIGRILIEDEKAKVDSLGKIEQAEEIVKINKIDELVFCSQDISASAIIECMLCLKNPSTDFKIAPPESVSVIGSNSINTAGDLYVVDINSLSKGVNKRKKRMFDILAGFIILVISPVLFLFIKKPLTILKNCILVIIGKYTLVGIEFKKGTIMHHHISKPGVLNPVDVLHKEANSKLAQRMNVMYAKDYKTLNDLSIVARSIKYLGRSVNTNSN